ncbi:MAG: helix-turn-helix transcriptional regulator [Bacilli bacterium]|nr:helix-turn-helix transcriptional regulator [Bacilli bacterium]
MKLSDYLKQYRKENNLTQEALAEKLYVTKQAVSKWENNRGLPDIETYKDLSRLLDVSVDTLLGLEEKETQKKTNSKVLLVIISIMVLLVGIVIAILAIINKPKEDETLKQALIEKTEEELGVTIPSVKEYNYIDYSDWIIAGNSMLPRNIYYFIFENEVIAIDYTWIRSLSNELIDSIPVNLGEYPEICEYFKIIDLTTGEINIINLNDDRVHSYVLYCLDIEYNRLIVISFEV